MTRAKQINVAAIVAAAITLVIAGLLTQHSVSVGVHRSTTHALPYVAAGLAFAIAAFVPVDGLVRYAPLSYGVTLFATCLPLDLSHGVHRRLTIGRFGFQPSEPLKLTLVLMIAWALGRQAKRGTRELAAILLIVAGAMVPVLASPDLGTAILLVLFGATMMANEAFTARARAFAVALVVVAVPSFLRFGLRDYQRARLQGFLGHDPLGAGYQSAHAIRLVATGSFWGRGFGAWAGTEPRPLPEASSDFAFAVWAHEMGFVGVVAMVLVFGVLVAALVRASARARTETSRRVGLGVAGLVFWQAATNIAMVLGLVPVVGVPLPLVSHGGSSLVAVAFALGLGVSVLRERHEVSTK